MVRRGLSLLILLRTATLADQFSWIPFARTAVVWRTRIMPVATRRQRSSLSPAPVTSFFVSKDNNNNSNISNISSKNNNKNKLKTESQEAVQPPTTVSSSSLVPTTPKTRLSSSATATGTTTNNAIDSCHSHTLLRSWANHSHADYHNFTKEEADGIRTALLEWYTKHRRKLPWRGDPPPFDGSTSGINTRSDGDRKSKNNQKKKADSKTQKSIASFFQANPSTKGKTGKGNNTDSASSNSTNRNKTIKSEQDSNEGDESVRSEALLDQAIPVTGYRVWVSEIMLQQTRVEAVIPFWIKWMKSFPTVYDLAAATEDEVNAHWAGLGFYRRARYLHQGAKYVVQELDGKLPTTPQGLLKISGIGPYTASAIASIAYGVCVPVVDGNVCRVLSRLKGIANHIKHPILKDKLGWKLAAQIVEAGDGSSPGLVNQALMELGATYCAPAGSGIDDRDPLKDYYLSTKLGRAYLATLNDGGSDLCETIFCSPRKKCCELCDPGGIQIVYERFRESITSDGTTMEEAAKIGHSALPTDPPKKDKREEDLAMAVILNRSEINGVNSSTNHNDSIRYLMVKRPKEGLLAGQWEFPNVCVKIREKNKKKTATTTPTKGPKKTDRERALSKFLLRDLFLNHSNSDITIAVANLTRRADNEPLEHIFSHVKHYMWVEVGELTDVNLGDDDLECITQSGKNLRWMNKEDMKKVGITSGVKKVLQAVEKSSNRSSVVSKSKTKLKKRKR